MGASVAPSLLSLLLLDCHNDDSTLASLANAIEIGPAELEWALRDYDEARSDDHSEDPWARMPREVLERFGAGVESVVRRFAGACYFHGTRALDPEAFRLRGILPLDQMVEELWATLRQLVREEISDEEWTTFRNSLEAGAGGHDGSLYRLKMGGRLHFGPYGLLVRETFLEPQATGSHDYLGCPEIVQDIARCYQSARAVGLERRFFDASKPCIVKFRSTQLRPGAINAALLHAYSKLRDGELTSSANWSFDGKGEPVPAHDVVAIETCTHRLGSG